MRIANKTLQLLFMALIGVVSLSSCSDSKSYADRLVDENKAMNLYLSDCRVENSIPDGNKFEEGPDAPFYRMDEEGNVYMQVLRSGDRENNMASDDELIFSVLHVIICFTISIMVRWYRKEMPMI